MKPEGYYELEEKKICYHCVHYDVIDDDGYLCPHWCHLHHFDSAPIGRCEDWVEEEK